MSNHANPDRWFMGNSCKRGHAGIRYKKNGACIECEVACRNQRALEAYAILAEYNGTGIVCHNCGLDDWEGLTIAHVNDDGRAHAAEVLAAGRGLAGGGSVKHIYDEIILRAAHTKYKLALECGSCQLKAEHRRTRRLIEEFKRAHAVRLEAVPTS